MTEIREKTHQLKRQNLILAKFLSGLIYPTMFIALIGFGFILIAFSQTDILKRILFILPSFIASGIFIAILYHLQKYLSNFILPVLLKSTIRWAVISLIAATIILPLSFMMEDKSIAGKMQIGAVIIYFAFACFMMRISRQIPETRGVFVEGVEDFTRLHLLPTNYNQSLTQNLLVRSTNANVLYVAVATPIYVFRMFSKAQKYAEKHRFEGEHYLQ